MTSSVTESAVRARSPSRGGLSPSAGPFWCSARGARSLKTLRLLQAQQAFANHKEVGQGAGDHQAMAVLRQAAVAHLGEAEDPLDHPNGMLHSNPDPRLPSIRGAAPGP